MMALGEKESHSSKVKLAVVDVETTGLDPVQDELIALSVVCVEVDRVSGELLKIIDSYTGQREPTRPMSPAIEQIVGISATDLVGQLLDVGRISAMLEGCELVVAHNAAFDRSFIEPHVPVFGQLAWGCSLKDIDWFGTEQQPKASIDHLLFLYGLEASIGTPQADCNALVRVLGLPLPVSGCTGFAALLASARSPRYRFSVPDPGAENTAVLIELGFKFDSEANAWSVIAGGVRAEKLESALVDMAVFDGRFEQFSVELFETPPKA
jgi:DNA polymerase-3 subunit epsilon